MASWGKIELEGIPSFSRSMNEQIASELCNLTSFVEFLDARVTVEGDKLRTDVPICTYIKRSGEYGAQRRVYFQVREACSHFFEEAILR